MSLKQETLMEILWNKANEVGREAGEAITPTVMRIVEADFLTGKPKPGARVYVDPEGPCGYAYIKINPARGPLVSWLKKREKGHKAYYGGWEVSIWDHGQSLERKSAHAAAMAKYLTDNGVPGVSWYERID